MARTFSHKEATREKVPLLIGLMGPSGGGKTFSALRLATGIQKVTGGDIFYIDTEARRSLHYADRFKFKHVEFGAPFGSLDYLAAIEYAVSQKAGVVVVDSMSHEHEGPGGMLETHAAEVDRLAGADAPEWKKESVKMLAWGKPKADRRRMINTILQLPTNFIFCFRAKEKIKLASKAEREAAKARGERKEAVQQMGFMPIAGEEFIFEMTVNCLLLPNAGGVPTWHSDEMGEKMMIKKPAQFHDLFSRERPLDESTGETLAKWAAGDTGAQESDGALDGALRSIENAGDVASLENVAEELRKMTWTKSSKLAIKAAIEERKEALESEAA